jgi:hypothetical protein
MWSIGANASMARNSVFQAYLNSARVTQAVTFFGFSDQGSSITLNTVGNRILISVQDSISANWLCTTIAGGVKSDVDSGVAADTNFHHFEIDLTSSSANFLMDGSNLCTVTSGLPSSTTMMFHGDGGNSPTGTGYNIGVAWLYVESDF